MNINNPIGPDKPIDRSADASIMRSGRTERTGKTGKTPRQDPVVEEKEQTTMDTVRLSQEVEELTSKVENMEEAPREEVIARAAKRVRKGDYNTPEIIQSLAAKLVNNELYSD